MLRIGTHPNNLHLRLARLLTGGGVDLAWVDYRDGRETAALLAQGAIDLGGTGSTPPLGAQAAGFDLVYLAASSPRPANAAVLVRPESPIARAADLAGTRVALVEGSFHTALLATIAEREGFALGAMERVDLGPAASAEALHTGAVQAWVAMDPHLAVERARGEFRALPGVASLVPNRSLFWTRRVVAESRPDALAAALARIAAVPSLVRADPDGAARALARAGEADAASWRSVLASRDWTLHPVDAAIVDEQQREADLLARHGALPRPIRVADALPATPLAFAA